MNMIPATEGGLGVTSGHFDLASKDVNFFVGSFSELFKYTMPGSYDRRDSHGHRRREDTNRSPRREKSSKDSSRHRQHDSHQSKDRKRDRDPYPDSDKPVKKAR